MREILFRGKKKHSGEWVEGLLWKKKYKSDTLYISCFPDKDDHEEAYVIDPETVCQYTGWTDKNGQEIWENDIIDASDCWWNAYGPAGHSSPIILVEWSDSFCGYDPFANYDCDCGVYICPDEVKVIGNIFDNPELLKEGVE